MVTLAQDCAPASIRRVAGRSTCTVTAQNNSLSAADVRFESTTTLGLPITSATGATRVNPFRVTRNATLAGRQPDAPAIAPGTGPAGYLPLDAFDIAPNPLGDEQALNLDVPGFVYAGQPYTRLGITSNGYLVAGGTTGSEDIQFSPQTLPDPAPPNNVLAPYWTDLDGTGAPGVFVGTLTDGVNTWIVVEWRVNLFGTTDQKVFQTWIGINGVEDISFAYDPSNLPAAPPDGYGLTVGAENLEGSAGDQIDGAPVEDLRVTSTLGAPGGTLTYRYQVQGLFSGTARTDMTTPLVRGTATDVDVISVTR